jgi:hypothetical protein
MISQVNIFIPCYIYAFFATLLDSFMPSVIGGVMKKITPLITVTNQVFALVSLFRYADPTVAGCPEP